MGKFKKVLIYEGKKLLFLPLIYFIVATAVTAIDLIGVWGDSTDGQKMYERELTSLILLYIFCGLLFICVCYRVFATRKLYEKVRVSAETVFWARTVLIAGACVTYTFVATLLGTVRVGALEYAADYPFVLTFIGKPWWYFLFFFSVALTLTVGYSVVELIANILYSRMRWGWKIASFSIPLAVVLSIHALPLVVGFGATIGSGDYFAAALPISAVSRELLDIGAGSMPLCLVSWNICNLPMLVAAIGAIASGYFSSAFFGLKKNEAYLYHSQKEGKNDESND